MKDIEALLDALRNDFFKVVGAVSLVGLVLALFLTRSVIGPVREAIAASKQVAAGVSTSLFPSAGAASFGISPVASTP